MLRTGNKSKILFVEGNDDKRVVSHIMKKANLEEWNNIVEKEGVDNLVRALVPEVKRPGRVAVGFVLDANDRPQSRWQAIVDGFNRNKIDFPKSICLDGTIVEANPEKRLPRIGVWLMPYNDLDQGGELEDFVIKMVPEGDPILPQAEDYIDNVERDDRAFPPNKRSKAVIHAWLATKSRPGQMGSAIERNELRIDGELCEKFVNWIKRLFQ